MLLLSWQIMASPDSSLYGVPIADNKFSLIIIIIKKKTAATLKSLNIARPMVLAQFCYIEQHVGLDCGIQYLGKRITATLLIANHNQLC